MIADLTARVGVSGLVATLAAGAAALMLWCGLGLLLGGAARAGLRPGAKGDAPPEDILRLGRVLQRVGRAVPWIAALAPGHAARLERLMIKAGRPLGPLRGETYLAATGALGAMLAIGVFVMAEVTRQAGVLEVRGLVIVALWALAIFGATQAAWYLLRVAAERVTQDITLGFPFYLDLAVLTIRARSLPVQTFGFYIEARPRSALAREFRITLREVEALGVETALGNMEARIDGPPIQSILRNLGQAQRTTGTLSDFYAEQAIELRSPRREIAIKRMRVNLKLSEVTLMAAIMLAAGAPVIAELEKMF